MTIATIGIIVVLLSPSVQGAKTTIRPIEEWAGEEIAGWADDVSGLAIHPHSVEWALPDENSPNFPFTLLDWEHQSIWECEYQGFIQERVIDEENTLITIHIHVKEVPFMIFTYQLGYIYYPPLYYGMMKYSFECRILFNTVSLYNILSISGKIPPIFEIMAAADPDLNTRFWPYQGEPAPLIIFIHFVGDGDLTAAGWPVPVPCDGKVLVNQVGIWDLGLGDFRYPHDSVIIK